MLHPARLAFVAIAATAAPAGAAGDDGGSAELRFRIGPVPAWVDPVPLPDLRTPPADATASYTLLLDRQTRHAASGAERYYHFAELVVSSAGIDDAALMRAYFEPSYERLTLHFVRVHRTGHAREVLDRKQVRLAHVEENLHARLYHGMASAIFFVPDVRVGDVVEMAFSTHGDNPVFGGRIIGDTRLQQTYPIAHLRERLLVPAGRALDVRGNPAPAQLRRRTTGGWDELVWEASALPAVRADDDRPSWHRSLAWVEWSDYSGWSGVRAWAADLYRTPPGTAAALRPLADQLRAQHTNPRDRLVAATRFVQDEVRYLGIEAGPSSHRPHPPAEVLGQRFGDCKDKSWLLAALLGELGIEAAPAMVDSTGDPGTADAVPSPYAFDHVIVRARMDGTELWIDPTDNMARGREFAPPPYRWALVVGDGGSGLAAIPEPSLSGPNLQVLSEYTVPDEDSDAPGRLSITTRMFADEADRMRRRMAEETRDDIARGYLEFYQRDFPGLTAAADFSIEDDPVGNLIVLHEAYTIPAFWADGARDLWAYDVLGRLVRPAAGPRTAPLQVNHPYWVHEELLIRMPPSFRIEENRSEVRNRYFDLNYSVEDVGDDARVLVELRTHASVIEPADAVDYGKDIDAARDNTGFNLTTGMLETGSVGLGTVALALAMGLGVIAVLALVIWLTSRGPAPLARPAPMPASAGPAPVTGFSPGTPWALSLPPEARQRNAWGVAGQWTGIAGLILGHWLIGLWLGATAVVFSVLGLRQARRTGRIGWGRSVAGLILGIVAACIGALRLIASYL